MGYSIATPIRSKKAHREMMEFLNRNFDNMGDEYMRGPIGGDLSYDHGPCRIGFDGTTISDYMISTCAWVALKVGKRKMYPTKADSDVNGWYKYLRYDGVEDWPLYITSRWRAGLPSLVKVNWVGRLVPQIKWYDRLAGRSKQLERIEDELKRLEALWQKEQKERRQLKET